MRNLILVLALLAFSITSNAQASKAKKPAPKPTAQKATSTKATVAKPNAAKPAPGNKISAEELQLINAQLKAIGLSEKDYNAINAISQDVCNRLSKIRAANGGAFTQEQFGDALNNCFTAVSTTAQFKTIVRAIETKGLAEDANYELGKIVGANLVYTKCAVMMDNVENILKLNSEDDAEVNPESVETEILKLMNQVNLTEADVPTIDAMVITICDCLNKIDFTKSSKSETEALIGTCLATQEGKFTELAKKSNVELEDMTSILAQILGARLTTSNCASWMQALKTMESGE